MPIAFPQRPGIIAYLTLNKFLLLLLLVIFCCLPRLPLNAQSTLVSARPPAYPLTARAAGIDGPVKLKGTISKEGKMGNVHAVSGPPELQQAAIDAVQSWVYKPYYHLGEAVDVDTTVTVNFNMGKGKEKALAQAKAKAELAQGKQTPQPQNSSSAQ